MSGTLTERWERSYPAALAVASTAVWWFCFRGRYATLDAPAIFQTALTVTSITIGFLATAKSILLTSNSALLRRLRKQGSFHTFARYLARASMYSFVSLAFSAGGMLMHWRSRPDTLHTIVFAMWFFWAALAGTTAFRSVHLFCKFVELDAQELT